MKFFKTKTRFGATFMMLMFAASVLAPSATAQAHVPAQASVSASVVASSVAASIPAQVATVGSLSAVVPSQVVAGGTGGTAVTNWDRFTCMERHIVLRVGSRGPCVIEVQRWINRWGAYNLHTGKVAVDGKYGKATKKAVQIVQASFTHMVNHRRVRLTPDGVVGPYTWDLLNYIYM